MEIVNSYDILSCDMLMFKITALKFCYLFCPDILNKQNTIYIYIVTMYAMDINLK